MYMEIQRPRITQIILKKSNKFRGNNPILGFPDDIVVKNQPANAQFLGQEDPPEKEMATHSSIPA